MCFEWFIAVIMVIMVLMVLMVLMVIMVIMAAQGAVRIGRALHGRRARASCMRECVSRGWKGIAGP